MPSVVSSSVWTPHRAAVAAFWSHDAVPSVACGCCVRTQTACAIGEDYLFHDHPLAEYDLGEKTLQCGRRADAFKFFLAWKFHASQGFGAIIDHCMKLSTAFRALTAADSRFRVAVPATEATNTVCFWWLPPPMRAAASLSAADHAALDDLVPAMYAVMQKRGNLMVRPVAWTSCIYVFIYFAPCMNEPWGVVSLMRGNEPAWERKRERGERGDGVRGWGWNRYIRLLRARPSGQRCHM